MTPLRSLNVQALPGTTIRKRFLKRRLSILFAPLFRLPLFFKGWLFLSRTQRNRGHKSLYLNAILAKGHFDRLLLVDVQTSLIQFSLPDWVTDGAACFHVLDYFVFNKNWSPLLHDLDKSTASRELGQILACDGDFRATPVYKRMQAAMLEGHPRTRQHVVLNTSQRIDDYFRRFIALYNSIKLHGMQSSLVLQRTETCRSVHINVALGPDGELIKLPGGKHRLAVAKALGVATIPVQINMIHQQLITRVAQKKRLDEYQAMVAILHAVNGGDLKLVL